MVPFVMAIVFIIVRSSNMSFNAHSAESVLTSKSYRMHHTVEANWTLKCCFFHTIQNFGDFYNFWIRLHFNFEVSNSKSKESVIRSNFP